MKENNKMLEVLHVCANVLKNQNGINEVSVDNDNDDGEICFSVGNRNFILTLKEVEE